MADYAAVASQFRRFADVECGRSPLYRALSYAVADDRALLELASEAASEPKPNLLYGAVHYLLLLGADHRLRWFYPSLGGGYGEGDPVFPAFREFCLQHREAIVGLLQTRRVQTNEVGRAAVLLPAFALIAGRTNGAPLALIEVGASAGLLLLFDRYAYDFGDGTVRGDAGSPVRLQCAVRGGQMVPLPGTTPSVAMRVGIDLLPIDLRDPAAATWLKALVWADQTERFERLTRAIALAAAEPPALVGGDGLDACPAALAQVAEPAVPVVFHCHTLNQFPPEARERFVTMLCSQSRGRTLYHLALEYVPGGSGWPEMRLQAFTDGARVSTERLAWYQAHGDWVEWALQSLS